MLLPLGVLLSTPFLVGWVTPQQDSVRRESRDVLLQLCANLRNEATVAGPSYVDTYSLVNAPKTLFQDSLEANSLVVTIQNNGPQVEFTAKPSGQTLKLGQGESGALAGRLSSVSYKPSEGTRAQFVWAVRRQY